ncbi:hypothetical protein COM13_30045 [Bacillus pseudomycoides]|uniref:hypothetical protein n=1 Tax=Bacillus pseudomycoides TaxID=64104 RepID=UPI000BED22BA|nr:hypothetical protein [Bacillus pseudomycoides]PDX97073.1 hypothetical protein COO07_29575 [Bacillus pseudomycoides]PEK74071.1 hypothetical protein CN597_26985 [Bacillus pseudomycoides]PEN04721.1 hypothetical protein CN640_22525 [Bacillus pseudomycoides]PGB75940.1 hypothetical protein COM13_30045 [Bacillus pseudomycoides]PHE55792.1 hypothetical protein COF52_13340 [Bacillus pseudomycoides]
MLLFREDIALGVIKAVGEGELILLVKDEELIIPITREQEKELAVHVMNQENMLVPVNVKTHELFFDTNERWNEEDMEELQGASEGVEEDHE